MGSEIQGVISNASPWQLEITIRYSFLQVQSTRTTTGWGIGANVGVNQAGLNAELNRHNSERESRTNEPSKFLVQPGQSKKTMLYFKGKQVQELYFSVKVLHPKGPIMLAQNIKVQHEQMIRNCVWVKNGQPIMTPVCPQPCRWRFIKGNDHERNYPPGKKCRQCGQEIRCKKKCDYLSKYGGESQ